MDVDRFRQLLEALNISNREFAKNVGTDPGAVSRFVSGKSKPSKGLYHSIILTYKVNPVWLNGGDGPMFTDDLDVMRVKLLMKMRELNEDDLELLGHFMEYLIKLENRQTNGILKK